MYMTGLILVLSAKLKMLADRERFPLARATVGQTGSNACGDGAGAPSSKQEAHTLQGWEYVTHLNELGQAGTIPRLVVFSA